VEPVPASAVPDTRLGRYTLLGKLASGGMAEVFLARQDGAEGHAKTVVIKRILPHLGQNPQFIHLFWNEARLAALINHPNVVSIYELGKDLAADTYYMAMEYIDGCNLRRLARAAQQQQVPISRSLAAHIVADAAAGLDFAHSLRGAGLKPLNIVHGDVSAENILITYSGLVKVVDFGLAKAIHGASKTLPGQIKGKIGEMSPEQLFGKDIDRRTDVWALGVTLYWLLTGQKPFRGDSEAQITHQILDVELVPPPELPPELQSVLSKALAKNPDERYATCAALQADLEGWLALAGKNPNASSLATYMEKLFPEASDPDRLFTGALLAGGLPLTPDPQDTNSPSSPAMPGEAGRPDPSTHAAPNRKTDEDRPTGGKWPEAWPPDSVHGVSIDLGASSPPIDLVHRAPAGLLDPPLRPTRPTDDTEEVVHPRLELLRQQRRRWRLALGVGGAVIGGTVLTVVGISIFHRRANDAVPDLDVSFTVASTPAGAALTIDDKPTGRLTPTRLTHWDFSVPHKLSLELKGFYPDRRTVAPGLHPPDLEVALSRVASISASTQPPGATIRISGNVVGTTPTTFEAPAEKEVDLAIELAGFLPVSKTVRLAQGQSLQLDIALTPMARLEARSEPAGATVALDGQAAGLAPVELSVTADVAHHLEFRVPGLPPVTRKVTVKAGKQVEVVVHFEDPHDRETRSEIRDLERRLATDRSTLEKLQAPGGSDERFATFRRLHNEDQLTDEVDQLEKREQDLQDELSNQELELEDRIKTFNMAATVQPTSQPAAGEAQ
jgi:serine/threonine protein kinase